MTVWPSGLRRWLQAQVRKGVGSNPTAVSSLQQRCAAVSPTTKLNQHFGQNVAHVVLSTSTQHNVKFKLASTNRSQKTLIRSAIPMFCAFPSYPTSTTIICLACLAAYPEPPTCRVPSQSCQTSCSTLGDFTAWANAPWGARTPDLEVNSLTL